jgi:hypothetical protein
LGDFFPPWKSGHLGDARRFPRRSFIEGFVRECGAGGGGGDGGLRPRFKVTGRRGEGSSETSSSSSSTSSSDEDISDSLPDPASENSVSLLPRRRTKQTIVYESSPVSRSGLPDGIYFQTQNTNLGNFWRASEWKMLVYFTAMWLCCSNLVLSQF